MPPEKPPEILARLARLDAFFHEAGAPLPGAGGMNPEDMRRVMERIRLAHEAKGG